MTRLMRAPDREPDADTLLIDRLFGTWMQYRYGPRPRTEPHTIAWIHRAHTGHWHVFWSSQVSALAAAYVTDQATSDPANPISIAWYWTGYTHVTAEKLASITSESFIDPLMPIPELCRLPDERPSLIRPSRH